MRNICRTGVPWTLLLALVVGTAALAEEDDKQSACYEPTAEQKALAGVFLYPGDPKDLIPYVPKYIRKVKTSFRAEEQADALLVLVKAAKCSKKARKFLIRRRLDYALPDVRATAASGFGFVLGNDLVRLLPIMRDGLNDPDKEVRYYSLYTLWSALEGNLRDATEEPEKFQARPVSEDTLDEICDLVIWKGLCDEDYYTAVKALEWLKHS